MIALSTYSVLAAFHVMFVVLFLGVTFSFMFISAASRKSPEHAEFALGVSRRIQEVLVIPGGAFIFGTGLYLSFDGNWFDAADNAWLNISMAWYVIAWLVGTFVAYPSVKIMQAEVAAKAGSPGPPSERFQKRASLMNKVGPALGLSVLAITFLMVAKPF